jgi:4-aminobutyrate aminotransferase-like enzyme
VANYFARSKSGLQEQNRRKNMQIYDLPGPKAKAIIERDSAVISPSYARAYPFVMDHGRGSDVWDVDGNHFLDFAAGIAVTATGHSHPKVVQAIKDQYRLTFIMNHGSTWVNVWIRSHRLKKMLSLS